MPDDYFNPSLTPTVVAAAAAVAALFYYQHSEMRKNEKQAAEKQKVAHKQKRQKVEQLAYHLARQNAAAAAKASAAASAAAAAAAAAAASASATEATETTEKLVSGVSGSSSNVCRCRVCTRARITTMTSEKEKKNIYKQAIKRMQQLIDQQLELSQDSLGVLKKYKVINALTSGDLTDIASLVIDDYIRNRRELDNAQTDTILDDERKARMTAPLRLLLGLAQGRIDYLESRCSNTTKEHNIKQLSKTKEKIESALQFRTATEMGIRCVKKFFSAIRKPRKILEYAIGDAIGDAIDELTRGRRR